MTRHEIAMGLGLGLIASSAMAALIEVDAAVSVVDPADGLCSLIEAIENAELDVALHTDCAAGDGADRLRLAAGSTYVLSAPYLGTPNGLPSINQDLTIRGRGATIQRDFHPATPGFRLMQTSATLSLHELTFENGDASGSGGALLVIGAGQLDCSGCRFVRNRSSNSGGAVDLETSTAHQFVGSSFVENTTAGGFGGALRVRGGRVEFESCLVAGNTNGTSVFTLGGGGGVAVYQAEVEIRRTALLDNSADEYEDAAGANGGALYVESWDENATVLVRNSTISGNRANGGSAVALVSGGGGLASATLDLVTVALNDSTLTQVTMSFDGPVQDLAFAYQNSIIHGNGALLPNGSIQVDYGCPNTTTGPAVSYGGNLLDGERGCPAGSDDTTAPSEPLQVAFERVSGMHQLPVSSLAREAAIIPFVGVLGCTPGETVDQSGALRGTDGRGCDAGAVQAFDGILFANGFETGDTSGWNSMRMPDPLSASGRGTRRPGGV